MVNPSGHQAETFPVNFADTPTGDSFSSTSLDIIYEEGIFVGYRFYDKYDIDVLFPFGHGLSYTTFEYKSIRIEKVERDDSNDFILLGSDTILTVLVDVVNTGNVAGKTVVQLYISDLNSDVEKVVKELKEFEKVSLNPGEMKTISFHLNQRSFSWWNTKIQNWFVSSGNFRIIIGQSSRDKKSLILD